MDCLTETYALATTASERAADHVVAEVTLNGPASYEAACGTAPCLSATPEAGRGTVTDLAQIDSLRVRFRYTHASLGWGDMVRLDLAWDTYCIEGSPMPAERTVTGTAWVCRDMDGSLTITSTAAECPSVVDCVPPPMAGVDRDRGGAALQAIRLKASPGPRGAIRLRACGLAAGAASYRWFAPEGALRMVFDGEAIWEPPAGPGVHFVRVAAVSEGGVAVQVFRHRAPRRG